MRSLQIGSRYFLARVGTKLNLLGPIHISPSAVAASVTLADAEVAVLADRLLITGRQGVRAVARVLCRDGRARRRPGAAAPGADEAEGRGHMNGRRLRDLASPESIASALVGLLAVALIAAQAFAGVGGPIAPAPSSGPSVAPSALPTMDPEIRRALATALFVNQSLASRAAGARVGDRGRASRSLPRSPATSGPSTRT